MLLVGTSRFDHQTSLSIKSRIGQTLQGSFFTIVLECEGLINSKLVTHDFNDHLHLTISFLGCHSFTLRSFILQLNKYQQTKQQILETNQGPTTQLLEATTERIRSNPRQTNQVEPKRGNHRKT